MLLNLIVRYFLYIHTLLILSTLFFWSINAGACELCLSMKKIGRIGTVMMSDEIKHTLYWVVLPIKYILICSSLAGTKCDKTTRKATVAVW